jgi:glutamyl-Q tRNA(Asp) synthetase
LTFRGFARKSTGMSRPVFRFAPSPNGLLHLGHAYSALLNARLADESDGRLLLRIEDTDETRARPEFVQAIFEDLAWLGLRWEEPVRIQSAHFEDYDATLRRLWSMGAIYPCFCSRKQALSQARTERDPEGQPLYGGTCRRLSRDEAEMRMATGEIFGWRLDTSRDEKAGVWGDAVIAKRRVGSSYHVAVVTDDALQGVTHVVRGKDIEAATPLHLLLQRLLGLPSPIYHHHDLILGESGEKLSKSLGSTSLRCLRAEGMTPEAIRRRLGFS